jgi:hypothetical protein
MKRLVAQRGVIRSPWSEPMGTLRLSDVETLFAVRRPRTGPELMDEEQPLDAATRVAARGWARVADAEEDEDRMTMWAEVGWLRPRMFLERVYHEKGVRAATGDQTPRSLPAGLLPDYEGVRNALHRAGALHFQADPLAPEIQAALGKLWAEELTVHPTLRMWLVTWDSDRAASGRDVLTDPPHFSTATRPVQLDHIQTLAQGQKWATRGSGGVLFIGVDRSGLAAFGERAASEYFECLIHAGRIGQRSVLLLEQAGLRGRMTPALDEELACQTLGLEEAEPLYLLRFGVPMTRER